MRFRLIAVICILVSSYRLAGQELRVDTSFSVDVDGAVFAIDAQTNGTIMIGGAFTRVNGVSRINLARLNGDGSLDEFFNPSGESLPDYVRQIAVVDSNTYAAIIGLGTRNYDLTGFLKESYPSVSEFVIDSRRRLIFGAVTEWRRWNRLKRYNEDGSDDATFAPQIDWCCLNRGVNAVAIQRDGGQEKILIGGDFRDVNGHENLGLARLHEDGSTDTSFKGNAPGPIVAIHLLKGGSFYAATRMSVGRYFADGTRDPAFASTGANGNDFYQSIKADPHGGVIVLGAYCPVACGPLLRRFNNDGTRDTNFSVAVNGAVRALAIDSEDGLIIGGIHDGELYSPLAACSSDSKRNPGSLAMCSTATAAT